MRRMLPFLAPFCLLVLAILTGVHPAVAMPFAAWQVEQFTPAELDDPAVSGPEATPQGDGTPNLLRYALALGARTPVPAQLLPELTAAAEGLELRYSRLRHAPDLAFAVEVSSDLTAWRQGWDEAQEQPAVAVAATERVSVLLQAANAGGDLPRFARVRVQLLEVPAVATRTLLSWNFSLEPRVAPQPPTTLDTAVTTGGLELGPELILDGANRTWGASNWGATSSQAYASADAAIAGGKFITFTVTPEPGRVPSLARLSYKLRRTSTGPTHFIWQVRVGNGDYEPIGLPVTYTGTDPNGLQQPDLDLLDIPALQALDLPVTFRFVAWGGTGQIAFGRDSGDGLALTVRDATVSEVLARTGGADFDPWNQERWADWYLDGRLARPFVIDCSLRFAPLESPWHPDVSGLQAAGFLFRIGRPGITIDGTGVEIDIRPEAYRNRTLDQLIAGGIDEANASQPLARGIEVGLSHMASVPETVLRNISLAGFVQGVRVTRDNTHPVVVNRVVFRRNSTGLYLSGRATLAVDCDFLENTHTASYHGSGSHQNRFLGNRFRDNNTTARPSYGDIVLDTAYETVIEDNDFLPSQAFQDLFRAGIALYRNMGEDGSLREDFPRDNTIAGNRFADRSVGINVGARHGRAEHVHDLAREGRDYAARNRIAANHFADCAIGIKVNTSGNTVIANTFANVAEPVVLHAVGYSLTETTIEDQPGITVALWSARSQYPQYNDWFPYQNPLMNAIPAAQKLIHVRSERGTPAFGDPGEAAFLLAPSLALDDSLRATVASGGTPRAFAVGDFYENQDGDELAVIWEEAISRVGSTTYHSILFFDRDGIEVNRSGRSTTPWGAIAAGRFTSARGMEVAVAPATAIHGTYPVYVFRRGHHDPVHILLHNNPFPIRALAAGNFDPDHDLDEIAVVFADGPGGVHIYRPGFSAWSRELISPVRLTAMAGGRLDPLEGNDVIAGISADPDPVLGSYPIYLFSATSGLPPTLTAASQGSPWATLTAGNFMPGRAGMEIAAVAQGDPSVAIVVAGEATPRRWISLPEDFAAPRFLGAGRLLTPAIHPAYEQAAGTPPLALPGELDAWGSSLVILPESAPAGSLPLLWLATDPTHPARRLLRLTPLMR